METQVFEDSVQSFQSMENAGFSLCDADLHVAFGISQNFMRPLGVMITSLAENNKHLSLAMHIFTDKMEEADRIKLEKFSNTYNIAIAIYKIDNQIFQGLNTTQFTIAAYYRFLIPYVLASVTETFVYLDSDMICVKPMDSLRNMSFSGKIACVVEDHKVSKATEPHLNLDGTAYFNTGMMYIDIPKWKKMKISERCLDLLRCRSYEFRCFDQDALNIVLEHQLQYIDKKWNCMCNLGERHFFKQTSVPADTIFIHYIGFNKPWHLWCFHKLAAIFRQYSALSLWKDIPYDSSPRKYREMKMMARYCWQKKSYGKALYWFFRYSVKKSQDKM